MFKVVSSSTRKNRGEYIDKIVRDVGRDVGSMFTRKSNPPVTMVSGPGKLLMISDL